MSSSPLANRNRRADHRRNPRGGIRVTCRKGAFGLGENLALGFLDVSETGIRLLLRVPLDPNQEIEVSLLTPGLRRPLQVLANVVWCQPAADGTLWAGARFQKRLRYADFQAICR